MELYSKCIVLRPGGGVGGGSGIQKNNNTCRDDKSTEYKCGYKTEEILRLMELQNHVQPNTYCYNLVISACMKQQQQQQQ